MNLSEAVFSSHGRYVFNLHLVLVHDGHYGAEVREDRLAKTHDMILGVARRKQHRLSHRRILSDHLHLTPPDCAMEPHEAVALA